MKKKLERIKKINEMVMFELRPNIIYKDREYIKTMTGNSSTYGFTIINEKKINVYLNKDMNESIKEIVLNHELCHVLLNHWDRHTISEEHNAENNNCCIEKMRIYFEFEANSYYLSKELTEYIDSIIKEEQRRELKENIELLKSLKNMGINPEEYIEKCGLITYEKYNAPHYSAEILYELMKKEDGERGKNNGGCGGIKVEGDIEKIKDWLKTKGKIIVEKLKESGLIEEGGEKSKGEGVGEKQRYKVEEKEKYSSQIIEKVLSTELKWGEGGVLLKKCEKDKLGVKTPNLRWEKEIEEEVINVLAIIDVSGSMENTILIKSVNTALRNLSFYGNVYVMTFSGKINSIEKYNYNKGIVVDWGGTDIKNAIIEGLKEKEKLEKIYGGRFKTVLITDLWDSGFEELLGKINVVVTDNKDWRGRGDNIIVIEEGEK